MANFLKNTKPVLAVKSQGHQNQITSLGTITDITNQVISISDL